MLEMERRTYLRNFLIFLFTFYIKEISGSISNLRVTTLGSESLEVSWDVTTEDAFSIEASISPVDDRTSTPPEMLTTNTARWMRLNPGTQYKVKVSMIKGGIEVSTLLLFVTTVPAAPMDIRIMKFAHPILNHFRVTGSRTMMYPVFGAVVTWDQPAIGDHDDFELTVDPPDGDVRVPIIRNGGVATQDNRQQRRIVWDLTPGVLYEFTVRSKKNGVFSTPVSGHERMAPDQPTDIKVTSITPTSAVVSWDGEHRGILDDYIIETTPEGARVSLVNGNPTQPSRRLGNLIPGTKHTATVYSTMAGLLSFKPGNKDFYTPPAVPLGPVIRRQITSESVFITWNRPRGGVEYYEVVYFPTERDFGRQRERVWDPRLNLTRELVPASSYMVEIYAVSNDLYSEPLRQMVHTRPLSPNDVTATATQDTIEIKWDTRHTNSETVIKYSLETENEVITQTLEPGITETTITNLDENKRYVINVTTIRNEVESDPVTLTILTNPNSSSDETRNTEKVPGTEKQISSTTSPSTRPQTKYAALIRETSPAETTTTKSVPRDTTSSSTKPKRTTPGNKQESTTATTRSTTTSTSTKVTTTTSTEKSTTTSTAEPRTTSTRKPADPTTRTARAPTTTKTTTASSTTESSTSTEATPKQTSTTTSSSTTTTATTQPPQRRRSATTKASTTGVTEPVRATRSSASPGGLSDIFTPTASMPKTTTRTIDVTTSTESLSTTTQPTTAINVIETVAATDTVSRSTEKRSHSTTSKTADGSETGGSTTTTTATTTTETTRSIITQESTSNIKSGTAKPTTRTRSDATQESIIETRSHANLGTPTTTESDTKPAPETRSSANLGSPTTTESDTKPASETRSSANLGTPTTTESDTKPATESRSSANLGTPNPTESDTKRAPETRSSADLGTPSPTVSDTKPAPETRSSANLGTPTTTGSDTEPTPETRSSTNLGTQSPTVSHTKSATETRSSADLGTSSSTTSVTKPKTETRSSANLGTSSSTTSVTKPETETRSSANLETPTTTRSDTEPTPETRSSTDLGTQSSTVSHTKSATATRSSADLETPTTTRSDTEPTPETRSSTDLGTQSSTVSHTKSATETRSSADLGTSSSEVSGATQYVKQGYTALDTDITAGTTSTRSSAAPKSATTESDATERTTTVSSYAKSESMVLTESYATTASTDTTRSHPALGHTGTIVSQTIKAASATGSYTASWSKGTDITSAAITSRSYSGKAYTSATGSNPTTQPSVTNGFATTPKSDTTEATNASRPYVAQGYTTRLATGRDTTETTTPTRSYTEHASTSTSEPDVTEKASTAKLPTTSNAQPENTESPTNVFKGSTITTKTDTNTSITTRPHVSTGPEIIDTTPTSKETATNKTVARSVETTPDPKIDTRTEATTAISKTSKPIGAPGDVIDHTVEETTTAQTITVPTETTIKIEGGVETLCEPNNITVLVNKSVIGIYETEYGPLRFEGGCMGVEHDTYYRYTIAPNISRCGTLFVDNGTHVNISNTLSNTQSREEWRNRMVDQTTGLVDSRLYKKPFPKVYLHIRCTFPSQLIVETKFIPVPSETIISFNVSGVGKFSAIMQLFRDANYRYPYYSAPSLPSDGRLRVGIKLLKTKDEHISIAARRCWATPVPDSGYKVFYPLIEDFCVIKGALGGKLVILENGESKRARFEGPVFRFIKHSAVWLHCELKVCFGDSCDTDCNDNRAGSRRKREAPYRSTGPVISAGPIRRRESKDRLPKEMADSTTPSDESMNKDTLIIIVAASLAAVVLLLSVVIVIVFLKYRRTAPDKRAITHPDFNSSSWDRNYNVFEDPYATESGTIERRYAPNP